MNFLKKKNIISNVKISYLLRNKQIFGNFIHSLSDTIYIISTTQKIDYEKKCC